MQKEESGNQGFIERSILKKLPGGYHCCANAEGFPFLHISKEFLEILGWTKAEIRVRFENCFLNMIHPDDRELALSYAEKMRLSENENQYQNQIYRLEGKDGYHWVSDTSMWTKQGEESVFQCFIFDITEYIHAREKEIKEREISRSEQMHTLTRELKRSEEKLATEEEYLKVICRKYMLVYYVDLETDTAKVLRLDEHSNVWQMKELRPGSQFAHEDHLKRFAEQFVVKNPQEFQQRLSRAYITYRLEKQCRFSFRYESRVNLNGNCHYEIQVIRVNPDVFDGKVIVVSQEIDDVVLAERQQEEERGIEQRYLGVLTRDFMALYHVNLFENTSVLLKADTCIDRYDPIKATKKHTNCYSERVEFYCNKFVAAPYRDAFRKSMERQNILQKLRTAPRYLYRYCSIQTDGQQKYFEVQALRMNDNPQDGNILLAFRDIDDVVTAEQKEQLELTERLEQQRMQNEVLSALGRNYHAIFRINLLHDSYVKVACRDEILHYYNDQERSASRMLAEVCETIVDEQYFTRMHQFFDLDTLPQRLAEREFVETECITKEGNWHRARLIAKHRDENGVVTHILYVTQIIDNEKQREERLLARAEYADFANRSKTEFISQVAHDIRTPMNSIFGFLEIAEANIGNWEKVQYSLEKIRVAGEFLKDLVDDVLDVSRMEKGKLKLQPEEMNLRQLLEEFSIFMQNAKFDKKQKIHFNIYHILHENIVVDPLRLKQIYANVFSNAIKYTPDGGLITFDVHQEEIPEQKRVRIITTITDTGIGMSEEFMGKMFSKFERAVDTRVNSVSGYGLGLSIVKQLVEMMQGTIEVQSKLNEGTSVCIKLTVPYVEELQISTQTEKVDYAALCKGMHLLVAEDNELNREVVTELLAMYGLSCDCAEDGAVCVERFRNAERGTYDAILMDMQMPHMNGVDAAMRIRALPLAEAKTIPIIAMTANALKEDVQKCLDAGMNQHLSKPVDMVQLLQTLAESMQSAKTKE